MLKVLPIIAVNLLYIGQAVMCVMQGNYAGAFILAGYTIANTGLIATML